MTTSTRSLRVFVQLSLAAGLALIPTLVAAQQDAGSQPKKITRLAGRTTAISLEGANNQEELQSQIRKFEGDLRKAFAASGWNGDAAAFFQAIADGKATKTSIPRGEHIEWMAFRDKGGPTVMSNLEWAGRRPIDAWEVEVVNGTRRARFMVPAVCLNVSLLGERADAELERIAREAARPPTCTVQPTATCETKTLRIQVTSDVAVDLTSVSLDGRAVSGARSAGAGIWELSPISNGVYSIVATATKPNGVSGTCQGRLTVDCPVAVCRLGATYDADQKRIVVDSAGSVGEVSITGVRLPDGSGGDLSKLESIGPGRWALATRKTHPRRAGDYVYNFDAEVRMEQETETCSASVTVHVPSRAERREMRRREPSKSGAAPGTARADRWTLRFFGGGFDADGDRIETEGTRVPTLAVAGGLAAKQTEIPVRSHLDLGDGNGFGLGLEYRVSDLMGVELSTIFGSADTNFVIDIGEDWGMDDDSVKVNPTTLGVNFHLLRPDGPVDFYLGPVIGIVEYGDATYRTLGETFRREFDGDFGWGLNLGLDVPFGSSRWLFTANARYLDSSAEVDETELELTVDPLFFSVGLGVRF